MGFSSILQPSHSYELEMLAVVKSIERFHIYLYGLDFTVIIDCHALVYAMNKAHLNPRIARWTLRLQNYRFKVVHRKGEKMAHVDALSRIVAAVDIMPLEKELQFRQLSDSHIKEIASKLETSDLKKFTLIDGLVYRKCLDNPRFVAPESMTHGLIKSHHDDLAHCGAEKTVQSLGTTYWFPSMRKKVNQYIDNCVTCLFINPSSHSREGELQIIKTPETPFKIVHIDHFGPLIESVDGYKHILILVDSFSRYTWLFPTKTIFPTNTKEVIRHLTYLFNIFSNPAEIVSDRGTFFTSKDFAEFVSFRNIYHRQVAVAAPWSNGLVERINRFLKSCLRKITEDQTSWSTNLNIIQYVINNTYHTALKTTPSKLFLGYEQRNHADSGLIETLNSIAQSILPLEEQRSLDQKIALEASDKIRQYNKIYYDKHHKTPRKYKEGDHVLIRDSVIKPGEDRKLKLPFKGPYLVAKALNKNRYVIKDIPGYNISPRPYNAILSPDRIKPWIKPIIPI